MKLVRTLILPVAMYGAETWTLTAVDAAYASATIMTAIRRAASQQGTMNKKGEWQPGASNAKLRSYAHIPQPTTMFKVMRLRHLGATLRCAGTPLLRHTMRPRAPKKRTRGASHYTWHQQVESDLADAKLHVNDAHNMRKWKRGIQALMEEPQVASAFLFVFLAKYFCP